MTTTAAGPDPSPQQVSRKVAIGAAFMVLGRLAIRLISIISTLLLVRLLVPEDFGLIALAGAAVAMADTLTATGYAVVLVRRQTIDKSFYDTVWTLNLLRCLLLAAVVAGTAGWQAGLLSDERLMLILQLIALGIALDGLASAGLIRLQRELRFDLLFRQQVGTRLVSFVVTLALAWATQSYLCLVLGNLVAKLLALPYGYWLAPYRPALSLRHWRELLGFSKWSFLFNICAMADGQAANLVLGRIVGVQAVGMFNVSYQIAATPVTELAVPVRAPVYSGYARIQHDRRLLGQRFIEGLGLLVAMLLPLSLGIALVAPVIERLALGPAWAGAATVIMFCALFAFCDAAAHFTFNVFAVLARYAQPVAIYTSLIAIRLPAIILASLYDGVRGAVAMLLITGVLNAVVWNWQAGRLLGLRAADFARQIWRSCIAALMLVATVGVLRLVLPDGHGTSADLLRLACLVTSGALAHIVCQWLLWRASGSPVGAEERIAAILVKMLRRLRTPRPAEACSSAAASGRFRLRSFARPS